MEVLFDVGTVPILTNSCRIGFGITSLLCYCTVLRKQKGRTVRRSDYSYFFFLAGGAPLPPLPAATTWPGFGRFAP